MSKRFLVIAILLVALSLFAVWFIFVGSNEVYVDYLPVPTGLAATNAFVGTAIASTATAKAFTVTPIPQ